MVNQLRLLRSERLVAVHVGNCEPMLIKRFLKKRDAQIVRFMDLATASYGERARLCGGSTGDGRPKAPAGLSQEETERALRFEETFFAH